MLSKSNLLGQFSSVTKPLSFRGTGHFFAFALSTLCVELVLCVAFANGRGTPLGVGIAHFTLTLGLSLWSRRVWKRHADLRLPLLLTITVAFLGPLGAAGSLLACVLALGFARSATPFEQWYLSLFPEEESRFTTYLYEQLASLAEVEPDGSGVAPFTDILSFGTPPQKQAVITLISENFRPAFAPALRLALGDTHNAVRVQAATAITKLENNFLAKTLELTGTVANKPGTTEALWALAKHYDDYAFAGILDDQREQENRKYALETYREFLCLEPTHQGARLAIGRLLLRQGNYTEAANWFEDSLQQVPAKAHMLFWHMECLYQLGRFSRLRELVGQLASRFNQQEDFPNPALEAVKLWALGHSSEESTP